MEQKTRALNLLEGPILPALSRLALPIMATAFVQMAYNLTDMAWIGFLGSRSVAAVGAAGMFTWFAQGVMNIGKMGGQVMVAQSIGAGEEAEARAYLRGSLQITVGLALLYALICLLFAKQMIGFFNLSDPETVAQAEAYFRIVCGLILFAFLNQTLTGIYTSVGDSKTPFLANCIGLFGNMIFDPMLIFGIGPFPRMGVEGAAVATVSAQAAVTLALLLMRGRSHAPVLQHIAFFRPAELRHYRKIVTIGFPASDEYAPLPVDLKRGSPLFCLLVFEMEGKPVTFWSTCSVNNVRWSKRDSAHLVGLEYTNWAVLQPGERSLEWLHASPAKGVPPILRWVESLGGRQ